MYLIATKKVVVVLGRCSVRVGCCVSQVNVVMECRKGNARAYGQENEDVAIEYTYQKGFSPKSIQSLNIAATNCIRSLQHHSPHDTLPLPIFYSLYQHKLVKLNIRRVRSTSPKSTTFFVANKDTPNHFNANPHSQHATPMYDPLPNATELN